MQRHVRCDNVLPYNGKNYNLIENHKYNTMLSFNIANNKCDI